MSWSAPMATRCSLELDVTDRMAVFQSVTRAKEHLGRLDVIVNNAGYTRIGAIEELTEKQLRDQFETNLFGAVWVLQAALPFLREQARVTSFRCPQSPGSSPCRSAAHTRPPSGPSKP
ncbi:NAD(P)-dependent dehydrogenase (short-subunit alcohol dehydrogenase family) [Streptacidiphilus sp. MAP12-20]